MHYNEFLSTIAMDNVIFTYINVILYTLYWRKNNNNIECIFSLSTACQIHLITENLFIAQTMEQTWQQGKELLIE